MEKVLVKAIAIIRERDFIFLLKKVSLASKAHTSTCVVPQLHCGVLKFTFLWFSKCRKKPHSFPFCRTVLDCRKCAITLRCSCDIRWVWPVTHCSNKKNTIQNNKMDTELKGFFYLTILRWPFQFRHFFFPTASQCPEFTTNNLLVTENCHLKSAKNCNLMLFCNFCDGNLTTRQRQWPPWLFPSFLIPFSFLHFVSFKVSRQSEAACHRSFVYSDKIAAFIVCQINLKKRVRRVYREREGGRERKKKEEKEER